MEDQKGIKSTPTPNGGLHWLATLVACMTVVLLVAGALVTSNEAGDSVPDWPLSFGRWLIHPDYFTGNVRYEYSHRFVAGVVGVATLLLALWAWLTERRGLPRRLALIAFAGVVMQAVVGGVRVHFPAYKPLIAIPHALIAQSFFGLLVSLAVITGRRWHERREVKPDGGSPPLRALAAATVAAVLVQLVLGAGFRHQAFGIVPHVAGAAGVTLMIAWTALRVLRRHKSDAYLARPARAAVALVLLQASLGVLAYVARMASAGRLVNTVGEFFASMTLWPLASMNDIQPREPMISLTAAHLAVGALTLATVLVLALRCYQSLQPVRAGAAEMLDAEALAGPRRRAAV
ncbi:MAG: COX15/CtaA family protein [Blastocatellia bacterium]